MPPELQALIIKGSILVFQGVLMRYAWYTGDIQEILNFDGVKFYVNTFLSHTVLSPTVTPTLLEVFGRHLDILIIQDGLLGPKEEVFQRFKEIIEHDIPADSIIDKKIQDETRQRFLFNFPRMLGIIACGVIMGTTAAILSKIPLFT